MISKAGGRRHGVQAKSVTRRGESDWPTTAGGALSAPCKILDVSEAGVRTESRLFVKISDAPQLMIELKHGRTLSCGQQVVHVRSPKFGAKISSMSLEYRERLTRIFDDHVQTSFSRR